MASFFVKKKHHLFDRRHFLSVSWGQAFHRRLGRKSKKSRALYSERLTCPDQSFQVQLFVAMKGMVVTTRWAPRVCPKTWCVALAARYHVTAVPWWKAPRGARSRGNPGSPRRRQNKHDANAQPCSWPMAHPKNKWSTRVQQCSWPASQWLSKVKVKMAHNLLAVWWALCRERWRA